MSNPSPGESAGPRTPGPIEPPLTASEARPDEWFTRLLTWLGTIVGIGLWLLVFEVAFLVWLH